ncbi:succinylglutamate desuccinylase/aspartoacylase family protein [candidate division KSB1 bacterium]|nr:succinylglutamate desuccinylase/aspartoacylase family protein [candidate division KSB1 bacterium]
MNQIIVKRMLFSKKRFIYTLLFPLSVLFAVNFVITGLAPGDNGHEIYFKDTSHELNIYRIEGREPGPTLLIISGIHNEPGGYLTADQFVDISLKKGRLIVVPRANFQTIIENERGILGDMNRLFDLEEPRFENDHSMEIVKILKDLIGESDVMLNLHDGWGFFREEYIDDMHNPDRLGQSIIADTDVYYVPGSDKTIPLQKIAKRICTVVNMEISNEEYLFRFNNHDTFSEISKHFEQQKSATYYALKKYNIPAFGIETSKNITDLSLNVRYQTIIVNAFMEEFGIVREEVFNPVLDPEFNFLTVSINNNTPRVYHDGSTITLRPSDIIRITHIEANTERGLYADVIDHGGLNDFESDITIYKNTSIIIGKDSFPCGIVNIEVSENAFVAAEEKNVYRLSPQVEGFTVSVNGFLQSVKTNGILSVMKGDVIRLVGTSPSVDVFSGAKINFIGFWQKNMKDNSGDDQSIDINTSKDLDASFSSWQKGKEYEVRLENQEKTLATMRVRLIDPELIHLVLTFDNGNKGFLENGKTYSFTSERSFEISDIVTNIPNNTEITVNIRGFVGGSEDNDINFPVYVSSELLPEYSIDTRGKVYAIDVKYRDILIGRSFIQLNSISARRNP